MMQSLRNKMKHIMLFVLLAFLATIIFSWGMGGFKNNGPLAKGIIGKIDGRVIEYKNFNAAYGQQLQTIRKQRGDAEISDYEITRIRDQVWNQMVQEVLYTKEIARLGLTASAEEVMYYLRNSPPSFLTSNPQFQTDGNFDMAKYQQALNNPQNYNMWKPVENYLVNMIPLQKLQQYITGSVFVSPLEVKEAYNLTNQKVKAEILYFNPNRISTNDITISDKDVKNYFNNHKDDYQDVEKRQIDYILFPRLASANDTLQAYDDAKYILDELKDGSDFAELANAYSDDPGSASKGGDLGFFGKTEMVAPFADAVFAARPGDLIGPVKTIHGLHIIKVMASKREKGKKKMHAKHILLKFECSNETTDDLYSKAQFIHDESQKSKSDFAELCKQEKCEMKTSTFFSKQSFIPGIGMSPRLSYFVFNENKGFVGGPITSGNNIIVFQIKDIKKAGIKPFKEAKSSIKQKLIREKKLQKATEMCKDASAKIKTGTSLTLIADQDSIKIVNTDLFALQGYIPGIGRDTKLNGTIFKLTVNDISEPIISDKGAYIARLIEKTTFDESAYKTAYETTYNNLLKKKQQDAFAAWYTSLKEKVTIKDYREMYF